MKRGAKIIHRISAMMLLILLMLPLFTEAVHAFNDHEHPICTDVTTHLHEQETDCSICDFQHIPWTYSLTEFSIENSVRLFNQTIKEYTNASHSTLLLTKGQRGPPALS